jgi:hypothetical protein
MAAARVVDRNDRVTDRDQAPRDRAVGTREHLGRTIEETTAQA